MRSKQRKRQPLPPLSLCLSSAPSILSNRTKVLLPADLPIGHKVFIQLISPLGYTQIAAKPGALKGVILETNTLGDTMPSLLPRKQILFESDVVEQARALRIDDAGTEICLRDSAGQEQALPTEVKAIVLQVLESLQTKTAVNLKPLNKSLTSTEVAGG
ncbi:hypothetical protein [Corynebacterium camporealensis]